MYTLQNVVKNNNRRLMIAEVLVDNKQVKLHKSSACGMEVEMLFGEESSTRKSLSSRPWERLRYAIEPAH